MKSIGVEWESRKRVGRQKAEKKNAERKNIENRIY
jgi:hypothetical protein